MLLIRLLAIFLVLITNTWLLSPVRSNALGRYKRAMAQRADRELSRLTGEPCTVSGVWKSRRQPRALSPSQHRPPAARPRTHTSRRELYAVKSAPAICAGGCRFDTGGLSRAGQDNGSLGDTEDTVFGTRAGDVTLAGRQFATDDREPRYVSVDAAEERSASLLEGARETVPSKGHAQSPHGTGARLTRSVYATSSRQEVNNSSWDKVSHNTTDPGGLHKLHLDDGDQQSSTGTQGDRSSEDYSGEVEEVDPPANLPVGSSSPWGGPVPRVPPSWMTALYFSRRRERLKLKPTAGFELPRGKFSLELWVKPEGGQSNPAVIAGG